MSQGHTAEQLLQLRRILLLTVYRNTLNQLILQQRSQRLNARKPLTLPASLRRRRSSSLGEQEKPERVLITGKVLPRLESLLGEPENDADLLDEDVLNALKFERDMDALRTIFEVAMNDPELAEEQDFKDEESEEVQEEEVEDELMASKDTISQEYDEVKIMDLQIKEKESSFEDEILDEVDKEVATLEVDKEVATLETLLDLDVKPHFEEVDKEKDTQEIDKKVATLETLKEVATLENFLDVKPHLEEVDKEKETLKVDNELATLEVDKEVATLETDKGLESLKQAIAALGGNKSEESQAAQQLQESKDELKQLKEDLETEKRATKDKLQDLEERIADTKYKLRCVSRVNDLEYSLVQRWEEGRLAQGTIWGENAERAYLRDILDIKQKLAREERVSAELRSFRQREILELQSRIKEWQERYVSEMRRVDREAEAWELRILEQKKLLQRHQEIFEERMTYVQEYRAQKAEEQRLLDLQIHRIECAVRLQAWWRGTMVRRGLGPFKKKPKRGKRGKPKK